MLKTKLQKFSGFKTRKLERKYSKGNTIYTERNIIRTFWKVLIIGKINMFQRIKLVKNQRKTIYNGRFKCAKV